MPCLSAPIPAEALNPDAPGGIDFTDFYVNGTRAKLTRYPAEGWMYADDVENHDGKLFSLRFAAGRARTGYTGVFARHI